MASQTRTATANGEGLPGLRHPEAFRPTRGPGLRIKPWEQKESRSYAGSSGQHRDSDSIFCKSGVTSERLVKEAHSPTG